MWLCSVGCWYLRHGENTSNGIFTAMSVAILVMDVVSPHTRPGLEGCLVPMLRASYAILGSRIILNLRGAITTVSTVGSSANYSGHYHVGPISFGGGESIWSPETHCSGENIRLQELSTTSAA